MTVVIAHDDRPYMIKPWKRLSHTEVDQNPWWTHFLDRFETSTGRQGDYHYVWNNNAVHVFVQLPDGTFVMLREYRFLLDKTSLSNPMGAIDPGESPEQAAMREVREEVGCESDDMVHIGHLATAPAFSTEVFDVFLMRNARKIGKPVSHGNEYTEPVDLSANEIDAAIASGEIWDSNSIAGWHMVRAYLGSRKVAQ